MHQLLVTTALPVDSVQQLAILPDMDHGNHPLRFDLVAPTTEAEQRGDGLELAQVGFGCLHLGQAGIVAEHGAIHPLHVGGPTGLQHGLRIAHRLQTMQLCHDTDALHVPARCRWHIASSQ